jgi:microcystin-dependent protein
MADPCIGEIKMFAGTYAPRGWALCRGQLISVAQNTALFSLLGTLYGGDGQTTFGIPDLQGRTPIGFGNGTGLTPRQQGEKLGIERVALLATQIPGHSHTIANTVTSDPSNLSISGSANLKCNNTAGSSQDPEGNFPAATPRGGASIYSGTGTQNMNAGAIELNLNVTGQVNIGVTSECHQNAGGGSHDNMPPYLAINFIIALEGLYPSRD